MHTVEEKRHKGFGVVVLPSVVLSGTCRSKLFLFLFSENFLVAGIQSRSFPTFSLHFSYVYSSGLFID